MELPVQITFRNMDHSDAVETFIRERASQLDSFYDRIIRCRVLVEVPHHRHRSGNPYHVRIDLTVPGGQLAISRKASLHGGQKQTRMEQTKKAGEINADRKDPYWTIREAFDDARRQLQDYARRQRGKVKTHSTLSLGRVVRLQEEYGFLETPNGREIYFHNNSVLGDGFERLKIGTEVNFVEEEGEKGPQASTVKLLGAQIPEAGSVAT